MITDVTKNTRIMKIKYLLLVVCVFFILSNNDLLAQNTRATVKTINKETYIIEESNWNGIDRVRIENKSNRLHHSNYCNDFSVRDASPLDSVFGKVLSKAKMNELVAQKKALSLFVVCLSSGKIEEVAFSFGKDVPLSLAEIQLLEKSIKKVHLKIKSFCPNNKYYAMMKSCRFERYAQTPQVK